MFLKNGTSTQKIVKFTSATVEVQALRYKFRARS